MRTFYILLFAAAAHGQSVTMIRGELLEYDGTDNSGNVSVRAAADSSVNRCSFDFKTYMEREQKRIRIGALKPGEKVEMLADRNPAGKCYAIMLRTSAAEKAEITAPRTPLTSRRLLPVWSPTESFAPRGNLTFSGVILQIDADRILLRTRNDGQKLIALRHDTRFTENGAVVERARLVPTTRVFIRAGRSFQDEVEAYSIMWGEILPHQ